LSKTRGEPRGGAAPAPGPARGSSRRRRYNPRGHRFPLSMNIIELQNVTAYRGDTRVFDGLSLAIPRGCNTAILGPNGAGKTTLLKLLAREIYPVEQEGSRLLLFGQERWNVWELRARLGIVSHDLQREYVGHATGLNVVLSGYYSS